MGLLLGLGASIMFFSDIRVTNSFNGSSDHGSSNSESPPAACVYTLQASRRPPFVYGERRIDAAVYLR